MERVVALDVVKTEIDGTSIDQQGADDRFEAALHVARLARLIARVSISAITGVAEWTGGLDLCLEEPAGAGGIGRADIGHQRGFLRGVGTPMWLPSLVRRPDQPRPAQLQPGGEEEGDR